MDALVTGALVGFSIAVPVGPVGLLCIRRSLSDGRLAGFVTGMGAAAADTLYGLAAAFSLTALTTFLVDHRTSFQLFGGLFMLGLGVATLRSRPVASTADRPAHHAGIAFVSAFAITATNPMTVLAFIGIFAGLNLPAADTLASMRLVLGVFLGSAAWWLILSNGAAHFSRKLRSGGFRALNLTAGTGIVLIALWQLAQLALRLG
ncbi:MAG: lysine transporter LysE [Opitutia bacterium Tous-C4FEB]|nr:MAG: lysine transporter LysE [Opitutae bacterium Tous-C5TDCM]PAW88149.1 MAG: lysine transporter LysE [Opitutae bacterium Tous-C4FEB]